MYIIYLEGISLDDTIDIETQFDKKLMEEANISCGIECMIYDKIPHIFTDISLWITRTNLKCWSCDMTFDTRPCFIPTYIKEGTISKHECGVLGNFCSFPCASAYCSSILQNKYMDNLIYLFYIFTGIRKKYIYASSPRTVMKKYGGYMSDSEFLDKLKDLSASMLIEIDSSIE